VFVCRWTIYPRNVTLIAVLISSPWPLVQWHFEALLRASRSGQALSKWIPLRAEFVKTPETRRSAVSCWLIGRAGVMKGNERGQGRRSALGDGRLLTNTVETLTFLSLPLLLLLPFSFLLFSPSDSWTECYTSILRFIRLIIMLSIYFWVLPCFFFFWNFDGYQIQCSTMLCSN
jgi:hypothetical protein